MKTTSKPPVLVLTNDDYIYGVEKGYYEDNNKNLKDAGKIDFINIKKALDLEKKKKIKEISNYDGEIFIYEPYFDIYLSESKEDTYASFFLNKALTVLRILKLMGAHCVLLSEDQVTITNNTDNGEVSIENIPEKCVEKIIKFVKKIFGSKEQPKEKENEKNDVNKNKEKEDNNKKNEKEEKEEKGDMGIKGYYERECKGNIKQNICDLDPKNEPKPIEKVEQELKRTGLINDPKIKQLFLEFCDNGGKLDIFRTIDIELTTEISKAFGIIAQTNIKVINAKLEITHKKFKTATIKQTVKVYFGEVNEEAIALYNNAKNILD